jgi:peptidyl-prolyl cis-trans isomerase D
MAILGNIRKQTTILILIIGLALFAFVISGIFSSNNFSGGGTFSTVIAEVNDSEISIEDFRARMEQASIAYQNQYSNNRLVNIVYDQMVRGEILKQEFNALGLAIEGDQIADYLSTSAYANIPDFQDENGVFNSMIFKNAIQNWKENDPLRYDSWLKEESSIINAAKERIYFNFVKAGVVSTLKEGAFEFKMQNDKADIQYIKIPYNTIPDSTIQVSRNDIQKYIDQNAAMFQQDAARDIRYVFFPEVASLEDEQNALASVNELLEAKVTYNQANDSYDTIAGFTQSNDLQAFLDLNSDQAYDSIYKPKEAISVAYGDSIVALNVGETFGPYKENGAYMISKLMGKKMQGEVRASHILIAYEGAERAAESVTRSKSEARAEARSLLTQARRDDVVFADLARENSDGPSGSRGGDLGYFQEGAMVDAFNDFCFRNGTGAIGLVETDFGFHIVKIEDKRDVYQVATLMRRIEPSDLTVNQLFTDATSFEMKVNDADASEFTNIALEMNLSPRPVSKIRSVDENLPGLGEQRSIVKWAFDAETNSGDIRRFDLASGYVVAQMTNVYEEGLQSVEDASFIAIPMIRKERKVEMIRAQHGGKNLDQTAKDASVMISKAMALTLNSPVISGSGPEPSVVGTALGLQTGQESGLIQGNTGVFMVRLVNLNEAIELPNFAPFTQTLSAKNIQNASIGTYEALKDMAEINDNRLLFY